MRKSHQINISYCRLKPAGLVFYFVKYQRVVGDSAQPAGFSLQQKHEIQY